MLKTIKQIADELKVDKQRVYRYIKKENIDEASSNGSTKWYDDAAQDKIKSFFLSEQANKSSAPVKTNDALYEALVKQLEIKDKQIDTLQKALENSTDALKAAQFLQANAEKKVIALEENQDITNKKRIGLFKRKKLQPVTAESASL